MSLKPENQAPDSFCEADSRRTISWFGVTCGIGAAIFYTLANTFLRRLSTDTDFVLVVFVKAAMTCLFFWPWLILKARQGNRVVEKLSDLGWLLFAAIQVQVVGAVGLQISLGIIGMALVVPIYIGSMVAGSAILGRFFLREPVDRLLAIALTVLIASVFVLCLGAQDAGDVLREQKSIVAEQFSFLIGLLLAATTGIAYAILGVTMRKVLRGTTASQVPLVVVGTVGSLIFGIWTLTKYGTDLGSAATTSAWITMGLAGLCNSLGFLSLSKSLQNLPVVYVNAINVSQVAFAALLGIWIFGEPLTIWLIGGTGLMACGFWLLAKRRNLKSVD